MRKERKSRTGCLSGIILLLITISVSSSPRAIADTIVEPHYTHCCLPRTSAHGAIPTSISGITEGYEIMVMNKWNVSVTGVVVYVPADFDLINTSVSETGWAARRLFGGAGALSGVSWNGSRIPGGTNTTFTLTLRNPDVGWHLSAVYTFLIVQTYENGLLDATRDPVEIIEPIRLFGIDSPALACTLLLIVFALPLLGIMLPVRNKRPSRPSFATQVHAALKGRSTHDLLCSSKLSRKLDRWSNDGRENSDGTFKRITTLGG